MTDWPHQDVEALNAFYGDPRGNGGVASAWWEATSLVRWDPPYPMFYSDGKHTPFSRGLRVHKKCLSTFQAAFQDVLQTLGHDYITANHLDVSGGTYCYRVERGGSRLSVHSWACAIDMDPAHNPFPAKWRKGMLDVRFAGILEAHGFTWRGAKGDNDPMHFQLSGR